MKVEYINPFITSTINVFQTMLNCELSRGALFVKKDNQPEHPISGMIGLSGKAAGMVVVSMQHNLAISAASELLGESLTEINAAVKDAVGEITNMVAGNAKAQLEQLNMRLTIPTVVTGTFKVEFPSKVPPICIPFNCEWGSLAIEVGLIETEL